MITKWNLKHLVSGNNCKTQIYLRRNDKNNVRYWIDYNRYWARQIKLVTLNTIFGVAILQLPEVLYWWRVVYHAHTRANCTCRTGRAGPGADRLVACVAPEGGPATSCRRSSRARPHEPPKQNLPPHVSLPLESLAPVWLRTVALSLSEPTVRLACRPCGSGLSRPPPTCHRFGSPGLLPRSEC